MVFLDCILLVRLIPALISYRGTNLLKFYYYYRLYTFIVGLFIYFVTVAYLLVVVFKSGEYLWVSLAVGLSLVVMLALDYYFCIVVRDHLMRAIKKDRKK